jgi:hypothetical protein
MSAISRVSLPQEFYDKTADVLLAQTEPQYLYALLFLNALAASMDGGDAMGLQLPGRQITGQGAPYTTAEAGRLLLSDPLTTDLFAAKVDFNGAPGNSMRFNRPAYANTTYTEASRRIPIGTTISTVPIGVSSEQNNLTLYRYGGPYDQANGRVAPIGIERFDANMGVHKLTQIAKNTIVRDFHRWLDAVFVTLGDLAANVVYPEGMTANDDAASKGSFPMTYEQLLRAERKADDLNLPTFPDGCRLFVGTPSQISQLGIDPLYVRNAAFHPAYNNMFPQFMRTVSKTHIFKSTTLTTSSNTSTVSIHYGQYLAPGVFMGGMGERPHIMPSTDDNYGQTAKVIWLADLALGLADNRFAISVRSSEDAQ